MGVRYPSTVPVVITNELVVVVPSGSIDSANQTFLLPDTPVANALALFQNGLVLIPTTDYTIVGATITMTIAPLINDTLLAVYTAA